MRRQRGVLAGLGKDRVSGRILTILRGRGARVAALVGDLATENDAARLARSGAAVKQIVTGTICHLDASMVRHALAEWTLGELDFLFIENVGNLVCPASYDLGEVSRLVLLSVTEGEDKPLKYPSIFNSADIAVITKADLAEAVEFDYAAVRRNIDAVRPGMEVRFVSARTGYEMEALVDWIERIRQTGLARLRQAIGSREALMNQPSNSDGRG